MTSDEEILDMAQKHRKERRRRSIAVSQVIINSLINSLSNQPPSLKNDESESECINNLENKIKPSNKSFNLSSKVCLVNYYYYF